MTQPIQQIADPDLRSLLNAHRQEILTNFNCHQVGVIVSFDPDAQTATVQLAVQKQVVDYTKDPAQFIYVPYPLLTDVPVFIPAGGPGFLTFPVTAGDPCLVLFNDRDLDNWFVGGGGPPNSARQHDLSDGMAIIGFRNKGNPIPDYDTDNAVLANAGGRLKIADKVALDGDESTLRTVLETVVDALTALNGKTGPSAATQITAVTTEIDKLLQ